MSKVATPKAGSGSSGAVIPPFYSNTPGVGSGASQASQWDTPANEPADNRPFDPRMFRSPSSYGGLGLQVGSIRTASNTLWGGSGQNAQTFTCFFLFNPNEIDKSYAFDPNVQLPPMYQAAATQDQGQGLVTSQTISFTLLFDRTFEVWTGEVNMPMSYRSNPFAPGPYRYGAQWDVWAIERILGVYGQWNGGKPQGPPLAQIVTVNFADMNNPQTQAATAQNTLGRAFSMAFGTKGAFTFDGWVQGFQASYTRFDANMTPTRAAVSLTLEQVYSPGSSTPGSSNATTDPGTGTNTTSSTTTTPSTGSPSQGGGSGLRGRFN